MRGMREMREMRGQRKCFPNALFPMPLFYVFISFLIILLSKLNLTGHGQI
jgi:hypothetical protein